MHDDQPGATLATTIQEAKERILAGWSSALQALPEAQMLDPHRMRDSLSLILDRVERLAGELDGGTPAPPRETVDTTTGRHDAGPRDHTADGATELLLECTMLREVVRETLEATGRSLAPAAWSLLDHAIDRAIVDTVRTVVASRERELRAFERLAMGPWDAFDPNGTLTHLVEVFLETVPSIDAATILVAEDQTLTVRATCGLEAGWLDGTSLRVGEGFSGRVAAERRPLFVPRACEDSTLRSPALRASGVLALYGAPLEHGGELVGVAQVGSVHVDALSEDEILLFRLLASRAAAVIGQARVVEQLTRAARHREELVGVVSHDLRSPLNAITLGTAMLLGVDGLPDHATRVAMRIQGAAGRMRRLVEQLLDFTRARLGSGVPLAVTDARLDELCRDVIGEIELGHPGCAITLVTRGQPSGRWDADRLKQLVANLVENAVRHVGAGPVRVEIDGTRRDEVVVSVHNDGAPIPSEELPTIFEPFRRCERGGAGLGLYIAREVVRAQGGSIVAESSAEDGTTLRVTLPRLVEAG